MWVEVAALTGTVVISDSVDPDRLSNSTSVNLALTGFHEFKVPHKYLTPNPNPYFDHLHIGYRSAGNSCPHRSQVIDSKKAPGCFIITSGGFLRLWEESQFFQQ